MSEIKPQAKPVLNPLAVKAAELYRSDTVSPVMLAGSVRLIEGIIVLLSGMISFWLYVDYQSPLFLTYLFVIAAGTISYLLLTQINHGFDIKALRHPLHYIGNLFLTWISLFAAMAVITFLLKVSDQFSRGWFTIWFTTGLLLLLTCRFTIYKKIKQWIRSGRMERRAILVGGGDNAEALILSLEKQPDNDIRICGIFDDREDARSPAIVAGYPKLGNISELVEFARIARIDMLIVTLPITAEIRVMQLLKKLWVLPVDIRLSAHSSFLRFHPRAYSYLGSVPMIDIMDKPISDWDSVSKRIFDIVFSILGIIAFSPIMILTAIAIKLDSKGPVLFKQKRHGFNNEVVQVFKFRSMFTDQCDPLARNVVTRNDPRVTRVGRFIRKTSIDELPQFFNVLGGSLSLVGPRPHAVSANSHDLLFNEVVESYFARHRVKPGVTGWAQINGWRGEIDSEDKIRVRTEYDLYYIENWSLWFDAKILFLTPIRLINEKNAY